MKTNLTLIFIFLLLIGLQKSSFAQSLELAGTYTTSDANFYKNTPGISFAYSHHFKRQFVFVEFKTSKKNDSSFATFYKDTNGHGSYITRSFNGSFSTSSVNIGAAQKIVTSECFEFSVGADAGLNYYERDFEVTSALIDLERNEIDYFYTDNETEKKKNKFGIGAFIDMELKNIFFDNLSLFSRLNIYHSEYIDKPIISDDVPKTHDVNSVSFRIGVKYRIPKAKE